MDRRRLLRRVLPRRVRALDLANENADFGRFVDEHVGSAPGYEYRELLYDHVAGDIRDAGPVDLLEFGVWNGASLRYWAEVVPGAEHRFYGFDWFQGLPEDWRTGQPAGTFAVEGGGPRFADERIEIVDGLFQVTLEPFLATHDRAGRRLLVHMDADLYSSTLFVLATLDRIFEPRDLVVFDDFRVLLDEFRAFADYRRAFWREFEVVATASRMDKIAIRLGGRTLPKRP